MRAVITLVAVLFASPLAATQPQKNDADRPPYERLLKGDEAKKARQLLDQLDQLQLAGKFAEAREPAAQLLALRRRAQGADHWQSGDARRLAQAIEHIATLPAPDQAGLAEALRRMEEAERCRQQGHYAEAATLDRQALEARRRLLGATHFQTASSALNLGVDVLYQGKAAEAEPILRKGLQGIREALGKDHPDTAAAGGNLAMSLSRLGRHAEAEALHREALDVCRAVYGEDHFETGLVLNNLAGNLQERGRDAEAEPLFRQALSIQRRLKGDDDPETALVFNNLARSLMNQGRNADAEPLYRQALTILQRVHGDGNPSTAIVANNLALNLNDQGRHAEAEPLLRQSLAIRLKALGANHPAVAVGYNNLALNLYAQQKKAEAETLYRKALDLRTRVLGENDLQTANTCTSLASLLDDARQFAEAGKLHERALAIRRRATGEHSADTANSYSNLAMHLNQQGKFAEAQPLHEKALAICQEVYGDENGLTCTTARALAGNLHAQGQYAAAAAMWARAAHSFESARLAISAGGLDRAALGRNSPLPALAACLARLGLAKEAWRRLEEHLARGLLDEAAARVTPTRTADERRRHADLLSHRDQLNKQAALLLARSADAEATGEPLKALTRQRQDVQAELDRLNAEWSRREVFDLERIQQALPADSALLSWVDVPSSPHAADPNGEHWACVVRSSGEPHWVRLPGSGPKGNWTLDDNQLPRQAYLALSLPDKADLKDLLRRVAAQRLVPVEQHLAGVRRLVIVPAGRMAGIPIEAMTDRCTISYAPSGTVLARLGQKGKPEGATLLALGDPVFKRVGTKETLDDLPGTRREVTALAALFSGPTVLLGSDASQQRLEELAAAGRLRRFRYLHLATHGVIDVSEPKRSALVLAQDHLPDVLQQVREGRRVSDGRLTMRDVLETWHLDAEVVTLSACRTALGPEGGGDGFVGFSQALLLAGARACVLSLWPVDDTATALLMVRFYQNMLGKRDGLKAPLGKAEALREAKAWLRELSSEQVDEQVRRLPKLERGNVRERPRAETPQARPFAHPYYWSAFILIGDPE